jgi:hypothetical protein
MFRPLICCFILILVPFILASAQSGRNLTGTGIGSDIAVPGEPSPEPPTVSQQDTRTTVVQVEPAPADPAPQASQDVEPSADSGQSVVIQEDRNVNEPAAVESPERTSEEIVREKPEPSAESSTQPSSAGSQDGDRDAGAAADDALPATSGDTLLPALIGMLCLAAAASLRRTTAASRARR